MPICSLLHHRFMYMTSNTKDLMPNRLKVFPFLHERRVYLDRYSEVCEYFNNTIETENGTHFISLNTILNEYQVFKKGGILMK